MIDDRLTAQLLADPRERDPTAVVRRLLAVQAQDARGARLAIRARTTGLTASDVDTALTEDRSLVISWLNRGTLHLVLSEDYAWLHALTTPQLFTANARRLAQEGVSPNAADRAVAVIGRSLADEGPLTRVQLRDRIARARVRTEGQALVHLLVLASLRGLTVRGPMVGRQHAYVLVRDWLDEPKAMSRAAALAELARRYLLGHGPADERDLAKWGGIRLRDARAGLEAIAGLLEVRPDGRVSLAARPDASVENPPPRLLGAFDPLLMGWASRASILGRHDAKVVSGGTFRPFALVRRRGVATWRLADGRVELAPFARLTRADAVALDADAEDVTRSLGKCARNLLNPRYELVQSHTAGMNCAEMCRAFVGERVLGASVGVSVRRFVSLVAVAGALAVALAPGSAYGADAGPLCAYGLALQHDGERQAAHAAFLRAVAANPQADCANRGVRETLPATSIATTAGNIAKAAGLVIGAIFLGLFLIGVAALLLLQIQTRTPWLRDRWPAKLIRRPVFSVTPLTDTGTDPLGSAVAGLIRGRVNWRTDRFGLNLVSGQAGVASAFSGLGGASGQAKAAVALITMLTALLPRRRFTLTGQLQPAGDEGVGISLELSQNGDAEALQSFWSASFHCTGDSDPTAYQQLAVPCAAWVDIWMTKALDAGGLLTSDPQSWTFFRSGVDAQRLGDAGRAQVLYEQALAADGTNVGALANLGIIFRRIRQYAEAEDYLNRALLPTEGTKMAPHLVPAENPDWYRIKYQLAALFTNWAADGEPGLNRDKRAARASDEARALSIATLDVLTRMETGGSGQWTAPRAYVRNTLQPFLEGTIEPSLLTLLAGTVSRLEPRPATWPPGRPTREQIAAALAANQIDPWQLIAYVELGSNRPPETQFNLACFYTRAGDLTTASKRLLRAVRETQRQERQRLVDVSLIDPVLSPLLEKRPGIKAKLYEMLDAKAPFPDADELSQHFDLQDRTISHFQSLGWSVKWDVDTKDIDLTASKDSQTRLIRLPGLKPTGQTVDAVFGVMQSYEEQHPDIKHLKASMVLPAVGNYPPDEIAAARDRGFEVLQDTGHGFESVEGS